jgi:hypothetical protein
MARSAGAANTFAALVSAKSNQQPIGIMKKTKMRVLAALTAMSMIAVLNLFGQTDKLAPPTLLRIQLSQTQSMPVGPGPEQPVPPKPMPVIPDPVAPDPTLPGIVKPEPPPFQPAIPAKPGPYRPPICTNHPPMFTNRPPQFTNWSPIFTNRSPVFTNRPPAFTNHLARCVTGR